MRSRAARSVEPVRAAVGASLVAGMIGVACSGGADSIALADAAIAGAGAAAVVVITIDHQLQPGSAELAASVAAWARGQGAAAIVRAVTVPAGASLEAAARTARYAALGAVADELGLAAVWTAHTARDQAETVLLRVLRGAGPAGLAGIPATRAPFVRPLLALGRDAIDRYVAARGLPVWADPMNEDRRFARVRVRHELLPLLRRENPAIDDALCRLAAAAAEWTAVIDAIAAPLSRAPISCAALAGQPPAIRKRAIALLLDRAQVSHDATHLELADALVIAPAAGERGLDLPGGRLIRSYDALHVPVPMHVDAPDLVLPPGYDLRTHRPGDRMRPDRLRGHSRKLSELYIDAKIPRAARPSARVVVRRSDQAILWAEHIGLAFEPPADLAAWAGMWRRAPTAQTGGSFR